MTHGKGLFNSLQNVSVVINPWRGSYYWNLHFTNEQVALERTKAMGPQSFCVQTIGCWCEHRWRTVPAVLGIHWEHSLEWTIMVGQHLPATQWTCPEVSQQQHASLCCGLAAGLITSTHQRACTLWLCLSLRLQLFCSDHLAQLSMTYIYLVHSLCDSYRSYPLPSWVPADLWSSRTLMRALSRLLLAWVKRWKTT